MERIVIDIIVSDDCEHCEKQIENVTKTFSQNEFRIIKVGSVEFQDLAEKEIVDAVPFIIVRDHLGNAKYAALGVHEGIELKEIRDKKSIPVFNLRRHRDGEQ
jgi:hypothetical protein